MADIIPAKAGEALTKKAREGFRKALGVNAPLVCAPEKVAPKADGSKGQWFCIDCGYFAQNQIDAHNHCERRGQHRMAWRNFATGELEEP